MAQLELAESTPSTGRCPRCGHLPQVGCLGSAGDGRELHLQCSLCFFEWLFPRGRCPGCGELRRDEIAFYAASEIPEVEVQACSGCRGYLHLVDTSRSASIVPEIEEASALALDAWARERGFSKIQPNLAGI
jgi:FdhE protein